MDSMHARYQRDIVSLKKEKVASVEFSRKQMKGRQTKIIV